MTKWKRKVSTFLVSVLAVGTMFCEPAQAFATQNGKEEGFENGFVVNMKKVSSYVSGYSNKDGGVAEIISYDTVNQKAWVVNGATGKLDILTLAGEDGISEKMEVTTLDIPAMVEGKVDDFVYGDMTSVAIHSELGIAAIALQAKDYNQNGYVALLTTEGRLIAMLKAGYQPDMITFTPDGSKILVANEGEPREGFGDGAIDPAGSVTIINVNTEDVTKCTAVTVGFEAFDDNISELLAKGILMVKNNVPSVDFEPEYIAATNDRAYIALQEANAIAILNLTTKEFIGVYSLGFKDLSLVENAIDLAEDGVYEAKTYENAISAYMPDGISVYSVDGVTYLLTANEGDAREWGSDATEYCNEIKETLVSTDGIEVKKVRIIDADVTDGLLEGKKVLYGGRSFSIYKVEDTGLTQVYDSGCDFEEKTAKYFPEYFNCSNDDNEYDSRSLKKGPEPESVAVGTVDDRTYAFVALERIGGIMVYDITNPADVTYSNYINTRNFSEDPSIVDMETDPESYLTSDIAPEGLCFINAKNSPNGTAMLLAAFEVSGTVAAYSVETVEEKEILLGTSYIDAGQNKMMSIGNSIDVNYYGIRNWVNEDYETTWISSDSMVASVDNKGVVTAVDEGKAYIILVLKHKATDKMFFVKPLEVMVSK